MNPDLALSTSLDILIAILLIATIAYAVSLNRKLTNLRNDKGEMEALIARLIEASEHARAGLEGLRTHASEAGEGLRQELDRARGRADELAFLIEKGEALSRRMDGTLAAARASHVGPSRAAPARQSPAAEATPEPATPEPATPEPAPPEEASLLKALQGMR